MKFGQDLITWFSLVFLQVSKNTTKALIKLESVVSNDAQNLSSGQIIVLLDKIVNNSENLTKKEAQASIICSNNKINVIPI